MVYEGSPVCDTIRGPCVVPYFVRTKDEKSLKCHVIRNSEDIRISVCLFSY